MMFDDKEYEEKWISNQRIVMDRIYKFTDELDNINHKIKYIKDEVDERTNKIYRHEIIYLVLSWIGFLIILFLIKLIFWG